MARAVHIQTPLGTFASAGLAAAAHGCTTANILYRVRTQPDHYCKLPELAAPTRPKLEKRPDLITIHDWPLAWSQYSCLSAEQREQLYTAWLAGRDPESEDMVREFFAEMDAVGVEPVEPEESLADDEDQDETIADLTEQG